MGVGKTQKTPKSKTSKIQNGLITNVGTRALWEEWDEWHKGLAGGVGSVCSHNRRQLLLVSSG